MNRIPAIATVEAAPAAVRPLLAAVERRFGRVPNLFGVLALSPAALHGYLALEGALSGGALDAATRARIALALAERSRCSYCLSVYTHIARTAVRLDDAEITANRNGASNDLAADAAVHLALALAQPSADGRDAALAAFKAAGYGDEEAIEIAALVALNTLATTVNKLARTEIDFPVISARVPA
jgi:AhpD family alkylhydroperoxidase